MRDTTETTELRRSRIAPPALALAAAEPARDWRAIVAIGRIPFAAISCVADESVVFTRAQRGAPSL